MKTVMSFFQVFLPKPDMNRKRVLSSNKIILILAICLLTLIGCVMESQEPVGEAPASINPQEWEGTWVSVEKKTNTLVMQVVDAPRGILLMKMGRWNEEKKKEEFSKDSEIYLRQSGDWLFANWKGARDITYTWGRIGNWALDDGGRVIIFWLPDENEISGLIKEGKLPGCLVGEKGKEKLVLGPLLPKHYQVIRDNEQKIFFNNKYDFSVLMRPAKQ
jgi:hypothetical protein